MKHSLMAILEYSARSLRGRRSTIMVLQVTRLERCSDRKPIPGNEVTVTLV
jgi:hypothetical protein